MAIEIEVKSNSRQARADLDRLNSSVDKINTSTENAGKMLKRLAIQAGAAFAVIGSTRAVTNITDSYRRLEARIALTTKSTEEQVRAFKQLNAVALETRSNQESLADLYSRISRATASLGVEQKEVLKITRSISQAITISGSSAESANSAIVQLGQGLAAGALRGQELNSVMEQTPAVAQAIARGMGITIGQLRAFANEGKLSALAVVEALSSQTASIDEEFSRIPITFAQASLVMSTGIGRIVNEVDKGLGVTTKITDSLMAAGHSLNAAAEGIGLNAIAFKESFESMTKGGAVLVDSLKHLGRAFQSLAAMAIDRIFSTKMLLMFQSIGFAVRGFGIALLYLLAPLTRIASIIDRLAFKMETFVSRFELGPIEKSMRSLSLGFGSAIGEMGLAINLFMAKSGQILFLFSRKIAFAFFSLEASITQTGIAFGLLGKELGLSFGLMGPALQAVGSLLESTLGKMVGNIGKFFSKGLIEEIVAAFSFLQAYLSNMGGNAADAFLTGISKKMGIGKAQSSVTEALSGLFGNFKDVFTMMNKAPLSGLKSTLNNIMSVFENFTDKVAKYFFVVYDKVVGNSYWPDLIDEVVAYTSKIAPAQEGIRSFTDKVSGFFKKGFGDVKGLLSSAGAEIKIFIKSFVESLKTVEGIALAIAGVFLSLAAGVVGPVFAAVFGAVSLLSSLLRHSSLSMEHLIEFSESLTDKIRDLVNNFDLLNDGLSSFASAASSIASSSLFAGLAEGLKGILVLLKPLTMLISDTFGSALVGAITIGLAYLIAPIGVFAAIMAGLFASELTTAFDSVLGMFGSSMSSLLGSISENVGTIVEKLTEAFVRHIPYMVGLVYEIGSGLVRGFLDGVPLIGGALSSLFDLINGLTLGLLGTAVGGGILYMLFAPKGLKTALGALFTWIRTETAVLSGLQWIGTSLIAEGVGFAKMQFAGLYAWTTGLFSRARSYFSDILFGAAGRAGAAADAAFATGLFSNISNAANAGSFGTMFRGGGLLKKLLVGAAGLAALLGMTGAFASDVAVEAESSFMSSLGGMDLLEGGLIGLSLFGTAGVTWIAAKLAMVTSPVLAALTAIMLHPVFLTIAAIVAAITAVGLIGAYFFGKGDSLTDKMDSAAHQLATVFGLADKYVSKYNQKGVLESIMGDFDIEGMNADRMFYDQLEDPSKELAKLGSGALTGDQFQQLSEASLDVQRAIDSQGRNLTGTIESVNANVEASKKIEAAILLTNKILKEAQTAAIARAEQSLKDTNRVDGLRGVGIEASFFEQLGNAFDGVLSANNALGFGRQETESEAESRVDQERNDDGEFTLTAANNLHNALDKFAEDIDSLSPASKLAIDSMLQLNEQVKQGASTYADQALDFFREAKTSFIGFVTSQNTDNLAAQDAELNSLNRTNAEVQEAQANAITIVAQVEAQLNFTKFNEEATKAFKEVGKSVSAVDLGFLSDKKRKEVGALVLAYRDAAEVFADSTTETGAANAALLKAATENLQEGLESASDKVSRKVKSMGLDISESQFANLGLDQASRINGLYLQIATEENKIKGLKSNQVLEQQKLNKKIQEYKDILAGILVDTQGINVAISNAGLTYSQITNSSDAQLVAVANTANEIADIERKLSRVGTISEANAAAYRAQVVALKEQLTLQNEQIAATRTIGELVNASNLSQDNLLRLSGEELTNALQIAEAKRNLGLEIAALGKLDEENLAVYIAKTQELYEQDLLMKGLLDSTRTQYELINGLSNIGFAGGIERFYDLGPTMQAGLLAASKQAEKLQAIMDAPNATSAEIQEAFQQQLLLTKQTEKLNEVMARGTEVAGAIRDTFADSVKDIADGVGGLGDVFKNVMKEIQSTLIDTAIDTLTNAVFGTDGGFEGAIQAMFAKGITPQGEESGGLFGKASSAIGGIGGVASIGEGSDEEGLTEAATGLAGFSASIKGAVGGLAEWGSGILSSILNFFGFQTAQTAATAVTATTTGVTTALSAAMVLATAAATSLASAMASAAFTSGIPGFATGGYVSGPGTGTSDSILAHLSNGEYVMNAKAVKENGALIAAINNGDALPKFATGGLVATGPTNTASAASQRALVTAAPSQGGQSQQVINLNITGDISRQTKKEVMKMLPSIAGGVNQHNRENQR